MQHLFPFFKGFPKINISRFKSQAYYGGEAAPIHGGDGGPGSDFVFTVPEGTEIVAASVGF